MIKVVLKQEDLVNITSALGVLVDEATIEITEQSLGFRGMDPAHIAMLDMVYPSTHFSTFEVQQATKLGIRVAELGRIAKRFGKDDDIALTVADSMLVLSNDSRTFKNRLIETSASSTPLPKLSLGFKYSTTLEAFKSAIDDVSAVSESIQFEASGPNIKAFGRGDNGECMVEMGAIDVNDKVFKASYSLDYLSKMVKSVKSDELILEFDNKMPCKLMMGCYTFFLAPRSTD